jgi:hypothetical protein
MNKPDNLDADLKQAGPREFLDLMLVDLGTLRSLLKLPSAETLATVHGYRVARDLVEAALEASGLPPDEAERRACHDVAERVVSEACWLCEELRRRGPCVVDRESGTLPKPDDRLLS